MPTEFGLVRYSTRLVNADEGLMDTADLARAVGLNADLVRRLYRLGVLDSTGEWRGEPLFMPVAVLRLRRMMRLRQDLAISWNGLGLIADLLERIDSLDARVRELEARIP